MESQVPHIVLALPEWLLTLSAPEPATLATEDARMRFVLSLVDQHVHAGTGGPFAAAVFERDSHRLVACGVNLVEQAYCSSAHAEVVALSCAQQQLRRHDLGVDGVAYELVSSTEPCAMCLGAVHWSGVASLVCGAADADARAAGFDEGEKPADFIAALASRGIRVSRNVQRARAAAQLQAYAAGGGLIYNPGGPSELE